MILETIGLGVVLLGTIYYRATIDYRAIKPWLNKWDTFMISMGIKNKLENTFEVSKVTLLENGVVYLVNIPAGLTVKKLESIKDEIDSFFEGVTTIKRIDFSSNCIVKIIMKDISDYEFEPVKCSESELFIGKTLDLENYKIDLTKSAAHILIGAPSGKGKSFLLASILTNLIYNSSKKIDLYLLQLMKADVSNFENCKCVKYTAYTLEEIAWGLNKAVEIIEERDKKFRAVGVNNLKNYNKHYPDTKFKRVYLVTEEISFFMPSDSDSSDVKEIKAKCLENLKTIVKAGRSSGVHLISVTQRSTVENIPSTMKSMMIRVSLGQISAIDSRNIIESDAAIYLKDKECIVYGDIPGTTPIRIPTVDEDFLILNRYVKEIKIPTKIKEKDKATDNENKSINKIEDVIEVAPTSNVVEFPKPIKGEFEFKGPEFKVINFEETAIGKTTSSSKEKKIKKRKGVYMED